MRLLVYCKYMHALGQLLEGVFEFICGFWCTVNICVLRAAGGSFMCEVFWDDGVLLTYACFRAAL